MKKNSRKKRDSNTKLRIEDEIKAFIVKILNLDIHPSEIEDQEMLFGGGLGLDSVKTLEIVSWMESKYKIKVKDEDVTEALFDSIRSLTHYIKNVAP